MDAIASGAGSWGHGKGYDEDLGEVESRDGYD